ncbi:6,7-dimethyl-8-ribityllumazine synthase [Pseudomonas guineae]|nr:6,7-dimethyl-8-ribityllumazine synthase [Pseudomonas guineae]|tara:strand:- start:302 stop:433 length:132 start_codon:yes stop_codon:yes gene_type:complete
MSDEIAIYILPGAFELPLHVKKLAQIGEFDAIIASNADHQSID